MSLSEAEVAILESIMSPIVGFPVDEARLSELGGSLVSIAVGGGLVWLQMCSWRIESDSDFLVACEDHRDHIRAAVPALDGRTLTSVHVSRFLDLTFRFADLRLVVFTAASVPTDVESWSVQLPSGEVLFALSGARWSLR
ncbi:hypothetical protein ACGGAQ_00810 [Micromonospora sp. NPDC047557]|uniref:hypothetical protein n=1 Tax=Micromonospora sp. NPDC047557 TaxID=3364250 RepID=UPI003711B4D9